MWPMGPMGVTLFLVLSDQFKDAGFTNKVFFCIFLFCNFVFHRIFQPKWLTFKTFGDNSCLYIYIYIYTYLIIFDRKKHGPNGSKIDLFDLGQVERLCLWAAR